MDSHNQIVYDKIKAALKLLTFRKDHVLVQFWRPRDVGKHLLLTTINQPYGLGVINEAFYSYRKDSERNAYVIDKDHEEEDLSPPARVFRKGLAEWTSDVTNYLPKQFPKQECAARCNLHGYLALPVFDTPTRSCIGVLELLTCSKYPSFAYEVQQFEKALKTQDLTCQKKSDGPASNVPFESRKNELDDIFSILKVVCDAQNLPLAQTWAMSPLNTFSSHEQILRKSCDSFDTKCLGKICMSTTALPYYDSERNAYVIDKDHEEEDLSPPARVFRKGLAEWTSDVTNYLPKQFPKQECAARCNLHGYLALPVFDTPTRSCIGVLELLTCSKYPSFAYEVQQFEKALKTQDLTCQKKSDGPASNVPFESRKNELDDIFSILKVVAAVNGGQQVAVVGSSGGDDGGRE
nr:hypothetical protein [Tanacetum cinerariifolium]